MRGSKLLAWRTPPGINSNTEAPPPANSIVPWAQGRLRDAVRQSLAAIAADVSVGLSETVGVKAAWCDGEPASVVIEIPPEADPRFVARAIDLENVEAWCDEAGAVHVGIHPWHSVKDTDQTVLAVTKVLHVRYGLHAPDVEEHAHPHVA